MLYRLWCCCWNCLSYSQEKKPRPRTRFWPKVHQHEFRASPGQSMDCHQIYSSVREKQKWFKVFQCTVTECKVQLLSLSIHFPSDCSFILQHLHCWFLPCSSEDIKICSCSSPCSVFIDYFDVQNKSHYAADQRGQFLSPK